MNTDERDKQRLDRFERLAFELHNAMPVDVMLKGDDTIWARVHGNDVQPRKIDQRKVLQLIHLASDFASKLISV